MSNYFDHLLPLNVLLMAYKTMLRMTFIIVNVALYILPDGDVHSNAGTILKNFMSIIN